jgi:hypothetical protein
MKVLRTLNGLQIIITNFIETNQTKIT